MSIDYDHIRVQYFDGTDWQDFGSAQDLDVNLRTRRFAPQYPVTAQQWRVVAQRPSDAGGTVALGGLAIQAETNTLSDCAHIPFAFDSDQFYSLWLSDQNIDVYSGGSFLASVPVDYVSDDVRIVTYTQALDTLLLWHKNYPVTRIFRQGRHIAWDSRPAVFENIPLFDFDGSNQGGVNAQQQIRFRDYVDGDAFNLTLGGETTTTINYTTSGVLTAIENALGSLSDVDASGLTVSGTSTLVTVTFTGNNGGREWPEMIGSTISSDSGGVVVSTLVRGQSGGEAVISATQGYPSAGAFFQQRTILGGYKTRPDTIGGSVAGDYYNLNTTLSSPDVGFDYALDGPSIVDIRQIVAGRHLMVFAAGAEFYFPTQQIERDALRIENTSAVGIRAGIRPIVIDGPALFIERRSGALRAFVFADTEQSYVPEIVSIHASHLLPDPIAMARRPARTAKEADLILIPNSGGRPMAALTLMRRQDVVAFTRFTTDGEILGVGVENERDIELAVKRQGEIWLEYFDNTAYLDSSVFFDAEAQTVFSVPYDDGTAITIMQDEIFFGRGTVESGTVTLDDAATGRVEIGLEPVTEIDFLPVRRADEQGGFSKDKYRIVRADFNISEAAAFSVSANDSKFYLQSPPLNRVVTDQLLPIFENETVTVEGFPGSSYRPQLKIKLEAPGKFHLRSIDMETSE